MKLLRICLLILPAALLGCGFIADTPVKTVHHVLLNNSQEITPCIVRAASNSAHSFFPLVVLAAAAETLVVALAEGAAAGAATAVAVNNQTAVQVIKEILVPAQAIQDIPQAIASKVASSAQPLTHAAQATGTTTAAPAQKTIASAAQAPAQSVAQSTAIAKPIDHVCRVAEERTLAPTLTMPQTLNPSSSVAAAQVIQAKRTGLWSSIKAAACAVASTAKRAPTNVQQFAASHPYITAAAVTATVGVILYSRYLKRNKQNGLALKDASGSTSSSNLSSSSGSAGNPDPNNEKKPKKSKSHFDRLSKTELQKAGRSHRELLKEHRQKLKEYKENPYANDNKGKLANAQTEAIRQKIIKNRIDELEGQIARQTEDLEYITELLETKYGCTCF